MPKFCVWFIDGMFKVSPTIFTQLFMIIGLRQRNRIGGEDTPLPYAYAFLSGKEQREYMTVLRAVKNAVEEYRLNACVPLRIMSDFELGIMGCLPGSVSRRSGNVIFFSFRAISL